jgi:hypothetical protein
MRTETLYALKKSIEQKCKEEILSPGTYEVNETVILQLFGLVKKSEDYEKTPTVNIPLKTALILCLDKLKFFELRDFKEILLECMSDAIYEEENPTQQILTHVKQIERAEKHLKSTLAKLPKVTCSGPTNVDAGMIEITDLKKEAALQAIEEVGYVPPKQAKVVQVKRSKVKVN